MVIFKGYAKFPGGDIARDIVWRSAGNTAGYVIKKAPPESPGGAWKITEGTVISSDSDPP